MNAFGFPWCPFGRAPDVELMENEFPILIPLSQHWTDSCGAGKHRGGVGTVQPWVAHQAPMVLLMCIADNSKLQTPQPLFGGYAPCTVPGIGIRAPGLMEALKRGDDIELDFRTIIEERTIGGQWEVEFMGRSIRPYDEGDVMGFCFSRGRRRLRRPAGGRPRGGRAGLRRRADQRVDDARDLQGRLRRGRGDGAGRRDRAAARAGARRAARRATPTGRRSTPPGRSSRRPRTCWSGSAPGPRAPRRRRSCGCERARGRARRPTRRPPAAGAAVRGAGGGGRGARRRRRSSPTPAAARGSTPTSPGRCARTC